MAQGLQTFSENGSVVIDVSSRIQKYLGVVDCPANINSGTVQNKYLEEGDLWYLILPGSYPELNLNGNKQFVYSVPTVTKSGSTLRWSFSQSHVACRILYGVF